MNCFKERKGWGGFTVLELLVVVVMVFIIAGLVLPALVRPPRRHYINCVNNLKQVGLAFRMWSDDNNNKYPMAYAGNSLYPIINNAMAWDDVCTTGQYQYTIFQAMSNELSTPKILVCQLDKRTAATNFTTDFNSNNRVSYFAGLDANEALPGSFLAGDWNLTNGQSRVKGILSLQTNQNVGWTKDLHNQTGNVAMGDGSVQQIANAQLKSFLTNTGLAANRLMFP